MNFSVFIEQDEDGIYVAHVPEIEGCYTQGKTKEEATKRIKEAITVYLEADSGDIIPMKFIGIERVQVKRPQIV